MKQSISDMIRSGSKDNLPGHSVDKLVALNRLDAALADVPPALDQLLALQDGNDEHLKEWKQLANEIKSLCDKLKTKLDEAGVETQTDGGKI